MGSVLLKCTRLQEHIIELCLEKKTSYPDDGLPLSVKIVTVNCARIIHGNQVATNGVVHVIDRVISGVGSNMKEVLDVTDELGTFRVCHIKSALS